MTGVYTMDPPLYLKHYINSDLDKGDSALCQPENTAYASVIGVCRGLTKNSITPSDVFFILLIYRTQLMLNSHAICAYWTTLT